MFKIAITFLLCVLAGCSLPPNPYSACASEPGGYACQVERYADAGS
jgi:hypothetical protein